MKIEIKRNNGKVLFAYECANNTIKTALLEAIKNKANLQGANLREADFSDANLQGANLREADFSDANLQGANLREADLQGANLRRANLRDADLREANLRWVIGNSREIKTIQTDNWSIVYTTEVMGIGCQQHPIRKWFEFDDGRISEMDSKALEFWRLWKPILKQLIKV